MKNFIASEKIVFYTVITFLFIGCSINAKKNDDIVHIVSIREAVVNNNYLFLSDFVSDNIEFVQLESKKEFLIGKGTRLYLSDSLIISFAENQIYLFDRITGNFKGEISHYGKDPQGYNGTLFSFPYDEDRNTIYTLGWETNSFYVYNIKGQLVSKKILPLENEYINSIAPINDTSYVGYIWNYDGKQKTKLIVFDRYNERLTSYAQHLGFEYDMNIHGISVLHWEGWFYQFNHRVNFFERLTDTIFQITQEELVPRFIFANGEFSIPYELRNSDKYRTKPQNYFHIQSIFESNRYLFFTFLFEGKLKYGIYDKVNRETKVSNEIDGIPDNLDNFVPFKFASVNNREEFIGYQEAYKILNWFDKNPEQARKLSPQLQKLNQINETDNPVIMIGRLKR